MCECLVYFNVWFYKIFLKTFFDSLDIFFISVSAYRAAAGVEEPVCIFPVEKIALWKLLAACHLENNDGESCHEGNNDDFDDHDPERLSP